MNRISNKQIKNRKNHKLALKEAPKDNKLQKQIQINDYNIIELNEEEINLDIEPDLNFFSEREILKLKKKATQIEEYYSNKSEDTNINENCFNCLMNNFKPNELLYFSKRKDLLIYLKYCFYFKKKILFLDNQNYIENRYNLDKCDTNYLNGWKFFIPKTVCRACFMQIINTENLFGNLKNIFCDIDPHMASRSVHRYRNHFNYRARNSRSMSRTNINRNIDIKDSRSCSEEKNKIIISEKENNNKIKIKNKKYNIKNNHNISYDDKKGLISIKRDILGEMGDLVNKKEENLKKNKNFNKNVNTGINSELNNHNDHNDEQSVTEIKIKTNEYISEGKSSENDDKNEKKNKENKNKNKNNESNLKNENKIKINKNHLINKTNHNNLNDNKNTKINSINEILINNNININTENESKEEKSNNNLNKNVNNMNIYNEILSIKKMKNLIVIKLEYKLKLFKDILIYSIMNIGDFKEKLINSMNFNPNIISYGIDQYEQYFTSLYNEGFKARKEFEEMLNYIKKESIPSIQRNILKLKEQEKLNGDECKNLDELEKKMNEFLAKIDEIEKKYEDSLNNFFNNFKVFFTIVKDLKSAFSTPFY